MPSLRRLGAALALLSVVAACADLPKSSDVKLTYETVPAGAVIYEGAQSLGVAPVMRTYKHDGKSASITTPDVTAVWPSGAKASFFTTLPPGADRVATIERPAKAPGLQTDLDHAKKIATAIERDEQRAKEAAARDAARNSARCKEQQAKGGTSPISDCF